MNTMESTTLDSTRTSIVHTVRDEYSTVTNDTAFIPTDDGDFIIAVSRAYYQKDWERYEPLCTRAQISITREHAEMLVKMLQEQLEQ